VTISVPGLTEFFRDNVDVRPPTGVTGGKDESFIENAVYARAGPSLRVYEDAVVGFPAPAFFSEIRFDVNGDQLDFKPVVGHSPSFTWPSHFVYRWNDEMEKYERQVDFDKSATGTRGPFPGFTSVGSNPSDPPPGPQPSSTHKLSP